MSGRRLPLSLRIGLALTGLAVLTALASFVWTPHDPYAMDIGARLAPPGARFWLGADAYGRDLLSQIMTGARSALAVALASAALSLAVGVPLGLVAAGAGGAVDEAVMRFADLVFAFPALLIAVILAALMGPGALDAVVALGLYNAPVLARLTRNAARLLWRRDFTAAARLAGEGPLSISLGHILPNLSGALAVQLATQLALAVAADAGLAYVGLGAQPPQPSWGRMLAEAQTLAGDAPWLAVFPGLALFLTVLGLTLTGDGLARLLDPKGETEERDRS